MKETLNLLEKKKNYLNFEPLEIQNLKEYIKKLTDPK